MSTFTYLDQSQEDELHKTRLLNVEEKPFKRITKRLLAPGSLINLPTHLPSPPPDSAEETPNTSALSSIQQFRTEVLLDFALFDSSIERIQFLHNSNLAERERYASEKLKILETAQSVRENTALLRVQLEEAKATLAQRKQFDALAEKILNNRLLRPRDEQSLSLRKLEEECRELEAEKEAYGVTWKERGEQFARIVEEGEQMRRLIRDEKEEVERKEGMEDGDEEGESGSKSQTPKARSESGAQTPVVESARTPGNGTPAPGTPRVDDGGMDVEAKDTEAEVRVVVPDTVDTPMADTPVADVKEEVKEVSVPDPEQDTMDTT